MQPAITPMKLVRSVARSYGACFSVLDRCPNVCTEYVAEMLAGRYGQEISAAFFGAPAVTACYFWIKTKKLYWYEKELAQLLVSQADTLKETDSLPVAALQELPGDGIYLKAPDVIAQGIDGAFLWLEKDHQNTVILQLYFLLSDLRNGFPGAVRLPEEGTLLDCLPDATELAMRNVYAAAMGDKASISLVTDEIQADLPLRSVTQNLILRCLQLALYLVTDNAEITREILPPEPHELQKSPEMEGFQQYSVGREISGRLRSAAESEASGDRKQKRAHVRKGHWHRFWKGPKDGQRHLVVHWVEPTLVGVKDKGELDRVELEKVAVGKGRKKSNP